jgi:hypothetical protein
MKTTLLALLLCCAAIFQTAAADQPLIPSALNSLLPKIHSGMTIHEVEAVLSSAYPKVSGQTSDWSGTTGYIDYKLDDRYSVSVASINRKDGKPIVQAVGGGGGLLFYIYDWPSKHRIEIRQLVWNDQQAPKAVTK